MSDMILLRIKISKFKFYEIAKLYTFDNKAVDGQRFSIIQ